MLLTAGAQVAPIVSEARTLGSSSRPPRSGSRRCRRTCGGAGTRIRPPLPRARPGGSGGSSTTTRSRCSSRCPIEHLEERARARAAQPHQLRLSAAAGVPRLAPHVGRPRMPASSGAAGGVLLGRVRPARVAADLLGRPGHPGGRPHQERRPTSACRWSAIGLFYDQGYFRQRLDRARLAAGGLPGHRAPRAADRAGIEVGRPADHGVDRDRGPARSCARLEGGGRPHALSCSTPTSKATSPKTASSPRGSTAATAAPDPSGAAARRRRRAGARRAGHHARRPAHERGPQRVRRAGAIAPADGRRQASAFDEPASACRQRAVFTTHTPVPGRPRPVLGRAGRRASRAAARRSSGSRRHELMGLGRVDPHERERGVLHDGAGVQDCRGGPTRCRRCTARLAARCGAHSGRGARRRGPDRPHHQRRARPHVAGAADAPALRPRTRPDWPAGRANPRSGTSSSRPPASCGKRTRR